MNAECKFDVADQGSGPQTACDESIIQDLLNARTPIQFLSAIQDAKPTEEADTAPVVVLDGKLPSLPQLMLQLGES